MAVTWDTATVTAVTLSGGNLVATNTGTTSVDQGAKVASANGKASGKYYFEVTWTTINQAGGNYGIGVGTFASTYTGMGNGGTTGIHHYLGGSTYSNGSQVSSGTGGWTQGQITGIAVDLDNRRFWVRASPSGVWNGNAANNPATNVGGFVIPAGTMVPFVTFGGSGGVANNALTANFGASAFSGTMPSGFVSWEAGSAPPAITPPAIRIKRRAAGGAAGAPTSLANGELAYNEQDDTLYYGKGDSGAGVATSIVAIGGTLAAGGGAPVGAEYITSTANATLTAERVLTDTATVTWDRTTAGQIKANAAGGGTATPVPPQGRLTLVTATPVMTTTQSAKTTIFYTPYVGNQIPLYNGTTMVPTTFSELSNVTTASSVGSAGPAAVAASSVYDLFVWSNAGTPTLTRGPAWTNDTTRSAGTALVMVNGLLLNNAAITNGPAASRGTYVGTVRSNASSQIDWIYGAISAGGTAGFFGLWNAYNRVNIASLCGDSVDSYSLGSTTLSQHSATFQHSFVCGLSEDTFEFVYSIAITSGATSYAAAAIGFDTNITTKSGTSGYLPANVTQSVCAIHAAQSPIGFHYGTGMEATPGGGTATVYGDAGVPANVQTGIWFKFRM